MVTRVSATILWAGAYSYSVQRSKVITLNCVRNHTDTHSHTHTHTYFNTVTGEGAVARGRFAHGGGALRWHRLFKKRQGTPCPLGEIDLTCDN